MLTHTSHHQIINKRYTISNQNIYIYLTFEAARVRQIVLQYSRDTGTHVVYRYIIFNICLKYIIVSLSKHRKIILFYILCMVSG